MRRLVVVAAALARGGDTAFALHATKLVFTRLVSLSFSWAVKRQLLGISRPGTSPLKPRRRTRKPPPVKRPLLGMRYPPARGLRFGSPISDVVAEIGFPSFPQEQKSCDGEARSESEHKPRSISLRHEPSCPIFGGAIFRPQSQRAKSDQPEPNPADWLRENGVKCPNDPASDPSKGQSYF